MRARIIGVFLSLALVLSAARTAPAEVTLTLGDARVLAERFLAEGAPARAVLLARGLLHADPRDAGALILLARGLEAQRAHDDSRRAAARAFRTAPQGPARFAAAQIAARNAYRGGHPELAKLWLRRSLDHAPSPALRDRTVADFRRLRQVSPWNSQIRLSIQPSDNVNSGTDNPYLIVEGLPYYGTHSASAMALSGTILRAVVPSRYRLGAGDASRTDLIGVASLRRVALTDAARRMAPGLSEDDLSSQLVELGIDHRIPGGRGDAGVGAALGRVWQGGGAAYDYGRLGLRRDISLGADVLLRVEATTERRHAPGLAGPLSDHLTLRGDLGMRVSARQRLAFGVVLERVDADRANSRATHRTAYASYALGTAEDLVALRLTLGMRASDYPAYVVGPFAIPGGRDDRGAFATLDLTLNRLGRAGFVPRVSLATQRTRSNISRFDIGSSTLGFGLQSKF